VITQVKMSLLDPLIQIQATTRDTSRSMTVLSTVFENNAKAAHAVSELTREADAQARLFATRPFNRFDTAFTEWWMIPSSDWPAYKYGKLCFWRYPNASDGLMYVGYYVEKGLDPDASSVPGVNPKEIMQRDWFWRTFEREVGSKEFIETSDRIGQVAGEFPSVLVHAHEFNKVPKEDQPRGQPSDAIEFRLGFGGENLSLVQSANSSLAEINGSTSLNMLMDTLSQLDLRFHWIDFIVGVPFRYGVDSAESWNAARLWQDALQPWLPWVR
jgi:hypothetical protein